MAQNSEKTLLDWALEYYQSNWSIIPIRAETKKPAIRSWKKYQLERADEKLLRKLFGDGNRNIAVIVGEVSNGLTCRDFDAMTEYEKWAASYPDLAKILPTVQTGKGMHVYFEGHAKGIKHVSNGELRGSGGYCLLPPSIHPDGKVYKWVNSLLNGNLLTIEPELAGFIPNVTEQLKQSEQSDAILKKGYIVKIDDSVEEAIIKTLPQIVGTRNRKVWELIRTLRADARFIVVNPVELRPVVQLWHKKALPYIRTKDFEETWIDFLHGWNRVILPKGEDPMAQILEKAKNGTIPEVALRFGKPKIRLLIAWCRELQLAAGKSPFYLSARTAGKYLEVEPMTAWRYLFLLTKESILEEVKKGRMTQTGGVATRFRYIAN